MPYFNTSLLQSFVSRTMLHLIIAIFISESDFSMYNLGQKCIRWKLQGGSTLVKIQIHIPMEDEQENTIQKNKTT